MEISKNKILLVYHSQTGNTLELCKAFLEGLKIEPDVQVKSLDALGAELEDLLWADALVLATPENFGYMSGAMKYFFDRVYYPFLEKEILGVPYVCLISCENNGSGADHSLETILTGMKAKKVFPSLICKGKLTEEFRQKAKEMGETFAAGLIFGIF